MIDATRRPTRLLATLACSTALAACSGDAGNDGAAADSADRRDSASATARAGAGANTGADSARRVASIPGFNTPESVKYDADLDVYFVSNINGNPSSKDGNGYIARVKPDSAGASFTVDTLVRGGRAGATLHAPKGMAIVGDTLWVTDIDAVRGFNRRTGAAIRSLNLASMQATFLNDVAAGTSGELYITDTGIRFAADGSMGTPGRQRIFRSQGSQTTIAIESDSLANPNGIAWDAGRNAFIVLQFGGPSIMTWAPGDSAMKPLASGRGQFDGVEVLEGGRILVSSWADSTVQVIENGRMRRLIGGVAAPADIGYDTRRNRVLVPLFNGNAVEVWSVGAR